MVHIFHSSKICSSDIYQGSLTLSNFTWSPRLDCVICDVRSTPTQTTEDGTCVIILLNMFRLNDDFKSINNLNNQPWCPLLFSFLPGPCLSLSTRIMLQTVIKFLLVFANQIKTSVAPKFILGLPHKLMTQFDISDSINSSYLHDVMNLWLNMFFFYFFSHFFYTS